MSLKIPISVRFRDFLVTYEFDLITEIETSNSLPSYENK